MVIELLELREIETARQLLRSAPALLAMKKSHEKRFARLESLTARPFFEPRDAYLDGSSREHRRAHLADALRNEIQAVPPARLLALLGQALKWQQQTGQLTAGARCAHDAHLAAASSPIAARRDAMSVAHGPQPCHDTMGSLVKAEPSAVSARVPRSNILELMVLSFGVAATFEVGLVAG